MTSLISFVAPIVAAMLAPASPDTPEATIEAVYAQYRAGGSGIGSENVLRLLTSPTREAIDYAIAADPDVPAIDADPFCDCQDFSDIAVRGIELTAAEGGRAVARVLIAETGMAGSDRTILIRLAPTAQGWRIEDAGPLGGWSLLEALNAAPESVYD